MTGTHDAHLKRLRGQINATTLAPTTLPMSLVPSKRRARKRCRLCHYHGKAQITTLSHRLGDRHWRQRYGMGDPATVPARALLNRRR